MSFIKDAFQIEFRTNSEDDLAECNILYTTSNDLEIGKYLLFFYPEISLLKHSIIKVLPMKIFSFMLTQVDYTMTFCYALRYTQNDVPKVIMIESSIYNHFFILLLKQMSQSINSITQTNIGNILQDVNKLSPEYIIAHNQIKVGELVVSSQLRNITIETINKFGVDSFVDIITKMLVEEKFVFVSSDVENIHTTIQAFLNCLEPFKWQFVCVPLLPNALYQNLSCIVPCIFGCLRSTYGKYKNEFIGGEGDVHVVDVMCYRETSVLKKKANLLNHTAMGMLLSRLEHIVQNEKHFSDQHVQSVFREFYHTLFESHINHFKQ